MTKMYLQEGRITEKGLPAGFVITDSNVASIYRNLLRNRKDSYFVVEAGEQSKSIESYFEIVQKLNGDEDAIVAFGGGVVGDLAGFVASTYRRGIDLIQVPTTLLAMVDSSIGGKNGVNLGEKKNYLGTIYQPKQIIMDPGFLETLPNKEIRNGLAEVIKYSMMFGQPPIEKLLDRVKNPSRNLSSIISACHDIKMSVVLDDERDEGYRHVLNFGHTIGHAIELLYHLSHGEAISIGMVKESELAEKLGIFTNEKVKLLKRVITSNGLPSDLPARDNSDKILEIMKQDKKGNLVFSLSRKDYQLKVDESLVREVLK